MRILNGDIETNNIDNINWTGVTSMDFTGVNITGITTTQNQLVDGVSNLTLQSGTVST